MPHCQAQQTSPHVPQILSYALQICQMGRVTNHVLCSMGKQTSPHAPLVSHCQMGMDEATLFKFGNGSSRNLALCATGRPSKPRLTPHCQAQQISPCALLAGLANLTLCHIVRRSKPRSTSHCQALQTSLHTPLNHSKPRPVSDCEAQQTSPCAPLSGTANLALCSNVRHTKRHSTPHC